MKRIFVVLFVLLSINGFSQFKENSLTQPTVSDGLFAKQTSSSIFGFLNSENFQMKHSVNMSYESIGGNGIAVNTYTNSMFLKVADNLNVQLDATVMNTPYNSLSKNGISGFNGIYISKAAVNYRPWKDFSISVQYRQIPNASLYNYYRGYYGGYYRGWDNAFEDSFWDR